MRAKFQKQFKDLSVHHEKCQFATQTVLWWFSIKQHCRSELNACWSTDNYAYKENCVISQTTKEYQVFKKGKTKTLSHVHVFMGRRFGKYQISRESIQKDALNLPRLAFKSWNIRSQLSENIGNYFYLYNSRRLRLPYDVMFATLFKR